MAELLDAWGTQVLTDSASVVISELATNAVLHGRTGFTVGVSRLPGGLRISVTDGSSGPPEVRGLSYTDQSGRGLRLVTALTSGRGWIPVHGGKSVWAELSR